MDFDKFKCVNTENNITKFNLKTIFIILKNIIIGLINLLSILIFTITYLIKNTQKIFGNNIWRFQINNCSYGIVKIIMLLYSSVLMLNRQES